MAKGVLKRRKALLQTMGLGLLIPAIWLHMFRSEHVSVSSLTELLRYRSWTEAFRLWFSSFYLGPLLLVVCGALAFPLVTERQGKLTYTPALIAVAYLVFMMWVEDFWHDGNSMFSWFGWPGIYRLLFLFMPTAAAFLGCHAVSAAYHLATTPKEPLSDGDAKSVSLASAANALSLAAFNLTFVVIAIQAVGWLQAKELGPFFKGFWHGSDPFLPVPSWLYRLLATESGKAFAIGWCIALTCAAGLVALRTRRLVNGTRMLLLSFVVSGFIGVWVIGEVFFNYYRGFELLAGLISRTGSQLK